MYRRRRLTVSVAVVALCLAAFALIAGVVDGDGGEPSAGSDRPPGTRPATTVASTTEPEATTTTVSTGRFQLAAGASEVYGHGPLHRYQVEVEEGTGVDPAEFAAQVDATLGHGRGWATVDGISLQRVSDGSADFSVTLATPATTDVLCFPLETKGAVSCANGGRAVLNLVRWNRGSAPSGLDLTNYRAYLISHEVGHQLGHDHIDCPGPRVPAPVMVQQTLSIGDCTPNPWPVAAP